MNLTDPIVMTLSMIMVGPICLSVPLLLTRIVKSPVCLPLALFLLANGMLALESTVRFHLPQWYILYTALSFPILALLWPGLIISVMIMLFTNPDAYCNIY